ncbi:hypothetical protein TrVE_jg3919 [Triparma verrucosa]|uniref:Membrane insertase YidC/Oxa/ALB C-terminal domain-containing protein n=1 Tax=Triparma verrucosa TaxID=1606542 RepID=A0A9W7C4B1_9STRA|nr:hypothetical protein TrVE_jg3919 [Triparma verrucosa]
MKFTIFLIVAGITSSSAFLPQALQTSPFLPKVSISSPRVGKAHIGPALHALPNFDVSSFLLSDAAADAVTEVAKNDNGWFGFLAGPIETFLEGIHTVLADYLHLDHAWGVSIILLTVLIKAFTYPLSYQQIASTSKMQALQPEIKKIQSTYQSNPEVMNQKIAAIYQDNEVNPLAGCIPSLVQLPVFIGLYRAVLNLAKADRLEEAFLWLPNLEGPTYGADPAHASEWIRNWVDGAPALGYADTAAFLSIPIILVISQFASMQLMQPPKSDDPNAPDANAVLKFLPLMIGYFSLNVPAALGIYWVANNFITTAITLQIKSQFPTVAPASPSGNGSDSVYTPSTSSSFTVPKRDKPSGFASGSSVGGVKPLTDNASDVIDAEPVVQEDVNVAAVSEIGGQSEGGGGKKKKKKKKKN